MDEHYREIYERQYDTLRELWKAIGAVQVFAGREDLPWTAEQRLAKIWEVVQSLEP